MIKPAKTALVCGGRDWGANQNEIDRTFDDLDAALSTLGISHIIHGGAKGADSLAGEWAASRNIPVTIFPAQWNTFGKSAGYRRNVEMAQTKPNFVIAFPGGAGTEHMIKIAAEYRIPVYRSE